MQHLSFKTLGIPFSDVVRILAAIVLLNTVQFIDGDNNADVEVENQQGKCTSHIDTMLHTIIQIWNRLLPYLASVHCHSIAHSHNEQSLSKDSQRVQQSMRKRYVQQN